MLTITKNLNFSLTLNFKAAELAKIMTGGAFLTSSGGSAKLQCVNRGVGEPVPKW
jgi:hypothetical protein